MTGLYVCMYVCISTKSPGNPKILLSKVNKYVHTYVLEKTLENTYSP